jgi:response regulator RpfG family c-di-GMP phosphodiesterase
MRWIVPPLWFEGRRDLLALRIVAVTDVFDALTNKKITKRLFCRRFHENYRI